MGGMHEEPDRRSAQEQADDRSRRTSRRRIDEIFGREVGTDDRRDHGDEQARDDWYRENRPPHHDKT